MKNTGIFVIYVLMCTSLNGDENDSKRVPPMAQRTLIHSFARKRELVDTSFGTTCKIPDQTVRYPSTVANEETRCRVRIIPTK